MDLWLFTISFPFGHGESFLENEIPVLAKGFDRILILPLLPKGDARALPPNVEVVKLFSGDAYRPASLLSTLLAWRSVSNVMRTTQASAPSASIARNHRRELFSRVRQALFRLNRLRQKLGRAYDAERVVLYSFWTSDWATVLGLWKCMDHRVHAVSRMHGFDLFPHRAVDGWQMFQAFHVKQLDRVFVASQAGLHDVQARFQEQRGKFTLQHMATRDNGPGPWSPAEELRIVSCSNLVPLKRVPVIAEALRLLPFPVRWTHFGDGVERTRLQRIIEAFPSHIKAELKGSVPNAEVIAWYTKNAVDVFVHASSTEGGAPVALQEAASFGIPLVAADAGGVGEIVCTDTGYLLPAESDPVQFAKALTELRSGPFHTQEGRRSARAFWAAHFEANEVHGRFMKALLAR